MQPDLLLAVLETVLTLSLITNLMGVGVLLYRALR